MEQDLLTKLPTEITTQILSKLPVKSIARCKCVCKSWLGLAESHYFAKFHLSKSVPGLAVFQDLMRPNPYKLVEFAEDDKLDPKHRCNDLLGFTFPSPQPDLHSSVDGLLFLCGEDRGTMHQNLFVCNPITREYIQIPSGAEPDHEYKRNEPFGFGFGVSKMRGEYKIVRFFLHCNETKCEVYTLGTGSWRSIEAGFAEIKKIGASRVENNWFSALDENDKDWLSGEIETGYFHWLGAFVNGNLHWIVDPYRNPRVCCFDLETERFSTFSSPCTDIRSASGWSFTVLEGCLCLCLNFFSDSSIAIWLMKEYGDDKSWSKEFCFYKSFAVLQLCKYWASFLFPVKVFEDGDILMAGDEYTPEIYWYSKKTNTYKWVDVLEMYKISRTGKCIYTPSFLSLKTLFVMEDVYLLEASS